MLWADICDLHPSILALAGPLTQFLNGSPMPMDLSALWGDVFAFDWDGDWSVLPKTSLQPETFQRIKTRKMFDQCKQHFVHHYTNSGFCFLTSFLCYRRAYDDNGFLADDILMAGCLYAAPMANMWLDELQNFLSSPHLLAAMALYTGSLELLQYLADEHCIEIHSHQDTIYKVEHAIDIAAEFGHLEMVKYLHENGCDQCTTRAMDYAAGNGHFEIVKWLHENRTEGCSSDALGFALCNGHVDIVEYLEMHYNVGYSENAMVLAAEKGNLDAAMVISNQPNINYTTDAMDKAAKCGHLHIVKYLHENRSEGCTTSAMDDAACNGHFDIVQFLHENRTEGCTSSAISGAASRGHLHILKFLHQHYADLFATSFSSAMSKAASAGHFDIVKFLHENVNGECDHNAMNGAAQGGHLNIVEYLDKHRTEGCTTDAMDYADNLAIVKYLHYNRTEGCTTLALDTAAKFGQLDMVQFLYENRSEGGTYEAMTGAVQGNHLDVVKYLHAQCKVELSQCDFDQAANRGYFDILDYYLEHGNMTLSIDYAVEWGRLDTVKYFHERENATCTEFAIHTAVCHRNFPIVKFLLTHRNEGFKYAAIYNAACYSSDTMLKCLLEHDPNQKNAKKAEMEAIRLGNRNVAAKLQSFKYLGGKKSTLTGQKTTCQVS